MAVHLLMVVADGYVVLIIQYHFNSIFPFHFWQPVNCLEEKPLQHFPNKSGKCVTSVVHIFNKTPRMQKMAFKKAKLLLMDRNAYHVVFVLKKPWTFETNFIAVIFQFTIFISYELGGNKSMSMINSAILPEAKQ